MMKLGSAMGKKKLAKMSNAVLQRTNYAEMNAAYKQGRYIELINSCSNLIDNPASDPAASFILAASFFRVGEFAQALSVLDRIAGSLESDGSYQSLCGATCRRLGLMSRASKHFLAALKLDPANPDVQNNYANLLIDEGKVVQARQILESLIRLHPHHSDARANLNRLAFDEQAPGVTLHSTPSQAWTPQDPLLSAFQPGHAGQGVGQSQNITRPNSTSINLPEAQPEQVAFDQIKLVPQALAEKKSDFALQLLSSAHNKLKVVNPDVYINAADTYIRLQRFTEAEVCILHSLAMGANTFANYLNLVTLSVIRRDLKLATFYLNKAAKLDPSSSKLTALRNQIVNIAKQEGTTYQFKPLWSSTKVVKHSA